ncbi:MAG: hypothetical protein AMXMBFR44_6450 [Candidatus Campbellbacteria bacterium]
MHVQTPAPSSSGGKWGIIIIIAVLAIGGFAYFGRRDDTDTGRVSGTIGDLMTREGDWKCTWSFEKEGMRSDGTVYTSGKRFKSDVESTQDNTTLVAHSISDGTTVYTWTNLAPYGTKFDVASVEGGTVDVEANPQAQMFADEYSFECEPWTADESAFTPPTGINFTDLSGMMQQFQQTQ